jgi:hypothetical protein
MEFMLQGLIEASDDEQHRNSAKIMLATSQTIHSINQFCKFADPGKDDITAETREDVIDFISHIESEINDFIKSHPFPEGTIFDK